MDKSLRWMRPAYYAAFAAICLYIGAALWGKAADTAVYAEAVPKTVSESIPVKCMALREEEPVSSSEAYFRSGERLSAAENALTHRPAMYFGTSDGLEYLSPESASEMTASELFSAPAQKAGEAKLVYGQAWYIAAVPGGVLPESGAVNVLIDGEAAPLRAQIVSTENDIALLRLTVGLEAHADIRRFSAKIVTQSVTGVEFPAAALRRENGETFVYAAEAGVAVKKSVELIHTSGESCISAVSREKDALCAGNTVIVSGENIYEGKVL